MKKQTGAAKKHVTSAIAWNLLKVNGSSPVSTRHCFARKFCPGSVLHILTEIRLSSQTGVRTRRPFLCGIIAESQQIAVLAAVFAAFKLTGLWRWGVMQPKGNATAHQK